MNLNRETFWWSTLILLWSTLCSTECDKHPVRLCRTKTVINMAGAPDFGFGTSNCPLCWNYKITDTPTDFGKHLVNCHTLSAIDHLKHTNPETQQPTLCSKCGLCKSWHRKTEFVALKAGSKTYKHGCYSAYAKKRFKDSYRFTVFSAIVGMNFCRLIYKQMLRSNDNALAAIDTVLPHNSTFDRFEPTIDIFDVTTDSSLKQICGKGNISKFVAYFNRRGLFDAYRYLNPNSALTLEFERDPTKSISPLPSGDTGDSSKSTRRPAKKRKPQSPEKVTPSSSSSSEDSDDDSDYQPPPKKTRSGKSDRSHSRTKSMPEVDLQAFSKQLESLSSAVSNLQQHHSIAEQQISAGHSVFQEKERRALSEVRHKPESSRYNSPVRQERHVSREKAQGKGKGKGKSSDKSRGKHKSTDRSGEKYRSGDKRDEKYKSGDRNRGEKDGRSGRQHSEKSLIVRDEPAVPVSTASATLTCFVDLSKDAPVVTGSGPTAPGGNQQSLEDVVMEAVKEAQIPDVGNVEAITPNAADTMSSDRVPDILVPEVSAAEIMRLDPYTTMVADSTGTPSNRVAGGQDIDNPVVSKLDQMKRSLSEDDRRLLESCEGNDSSDDGSTSSESSSSDNTSVGAHAPSRKQSPVSSKSRSPRKPLSQTRSPVESLSRQLSPVSSKSRSPVKAKSRQPSPTKTTSQSKSLTVPSDGDSLMVGQKTPVTGQSIVQHGSSKSIKTVKQELLEQPEEPEDQDELMIQDQSTQVASAKSSQHGTPARQQSPNRSEQSHSLPRDSEQHLIVQMDTQGLEQSVPIFSSSSTSVTTTHTAPISSVSVQQPITGSTTTTTCHTESANLDSSTGSTRQTARRPSTELVTVQDVSRAIQQIYQQDQNIVETRARVRPLNLSADFTSNVPNAQVLGCNDIQRLCLISLFNSCPVSDVPDVSEMVLVHQVPDITTHRTVIIQGASYTRLTARVRGTGSIVFVDVPSHVGNPLAVFRDLPHLQPYFSNTTFRYFQEHSIGQEISIPVTTMRRPILEEDTSEHSDDDRGPPDSQK